MIDLRKDLRHYIDLRRALGYRLRKHEPRLTEFIAFLKAKGTGFVLASEMRGPRTAWDAARIAALRAQGSSLGTICRETGVGTRPALGQPHPKEVIRAS